MLHLTVKVGQAVDIDNTVRIHVMERKGQSVRLAFETTMKPINIVGRDENGLSRRQQHME